MKLPATSLVLLFVLLVNSVLCEDVGDQLHAIQTQLEKLNQLVQAQQETIAVQSKRLDDQQKVIQTYFAARPTPSSPTADLMTRLDRAERQSQTAIKIAGRKKAGDLNPAIGAAIDTSFRVFDGPKGEGDRPSGEDFQLRGAELVFYTDVDPYFKTYMVVNAVADAANNDEAVPSIEEAAIYTTSLPHVQVKGGRFFMPFGRLSMIHDHDLPFVTRPPSIDHYVGGESAGDGLQVQALIPVDHFFQVTAGVFNKLGADFPLVNGAGNRRDLQEMTYFLKALTSFDIKEDHTIEWGVSTAQVPDREIRRDLTDIEFTYKWHPSGSTLREKLVWGTELLRDRQHSRFEVPGENNLTAPTFNSGTQRGYGGYSYVEYFLNPNWSIGPRIDLFENANPAIHSRRTYEQTYGAFAMYKFSEFSRLRFEYDRHEFVDGKEANDLLLQWTVFWGAHTHSFDQR